MAQPPTLQVDRGRRCECRLARHWNEYRKPTDLKQTTAPESVVQGTAIHCCPDPHNTRCCLYQFFQATNHSLLGNSWAHHRAGVYFHRLAQGGRSRCAIAVDHDTGAALVSLPDRDEFGLAAERSKSVYRQRYRARDFHVADAWHIYCRRPCAILADLSSRTNHGARHSGNCLDRKLGVDFRVNRCRCPWGGGGFLVALAAQKRLFESCVILAGSNAEGSVSVRDIKIS